MSYSMHDWFDDNLYQKLKIVFKEFEEKTKEYEDGEFHLDQKSRCEIFIETLKRSLSEKEDDRFVGVLLEAILNPNSETFEIDDYMKECFNKMNTEYELKKLEYKKIGCKKTVDYGFDEDEDF